MAPNHTRKPLVVVAGQVPPPVGGQNIMISRIIEELEKETRWTTVHLPFHFTPSFQKVRQFRWSKIIELLLVWARAMRLFMEKGRWDLLIYPSGGPQTIPVIRDILLLPFLSSMASRTVVQFHAAGIADRLSRPSLLNWLLRRAYSRVNGAIVMTSYNCRDPESLGIQKTHVIPYRLIDENSSAQLPDFTRFHQSGSASHTFHILHAGHLYGPKGTPELVSAFVRIKHKFPFVRLILMGEFLNPYSEEVCRNFLRKHGSLNDVEITGVLRGREKAEKFRQAQLFVFPSVAPYESFGLVMAEAMMWGVPLVATEWRGNRDVAGPAAEYVQPGTSIVDELVYSMERLINEPAKLAERSAALRRRFEQHFSQKGHADYRALVSLLLNL